MSTKYKNRVGQFIRTVRFIFIKTHFNSLTFSTFLQMMVDESRVFDDHYKGDTGKNNKRFLSPNNRGFRFISTKDEKLQEALQRNSIYESSPNRKTVTNETPETIMNLRPRFEDQELSGTFRFKPATQAERIAESIAIHHRGKMPVNDLNNKLRISNAYSPCATASINNMVSIEEQIDQ